MVFKDRQCRLLVYELTKSEFIHDIIIIRALKYTRSDPGLWRNKSVRFQFLLSKRFVPLGQAIHLCVTYECLNIARGTIDTYKLTPRIGSVP